MHFKEAEDSPHEEKEVSHYCMYCTKDISMYNLDFKRDIVCGTCVQRLVGTKNIPKKHAQKRHRRRSTCKTIGGVGGRVGKKNATGVR